MCVSVKKISFYLNVTTRNGVRYYIFRQCSYRRMDFHDVSSRRFQRDNKVFLTDELSMCAHKGRS